MQVEMLKSKVHGAEVSGIFPYYEGSIGIGQAILDASNILPYQKILVAVIETGERFETYVIPEGDQTAIYINGDAAQKVEIGQHVIIMAFVSVPWEEAGNIDPTIVVLEDGNEIGE